MELLYSKKKKNLAFIQAVDRRPGRIMAWVLGGRERQHTNGALIHSTI